MATLKHIVNSKNPHVAPHQVWHFGPNDYKVIVNGVGVVKSFSNLSQAASFATDKVKKIEAFLLS